MVHHCLQIPEVVRFICDGLDGKSAYSMALVAKRFLEPALDVRWRELTSFVPIIRCLPDDVWTMEASSDNAAIKIIVCMSRMPFEYCYLNSPGY